MKAHRVEQINGRGQARRSGPLAERALAIREEVLGPGHPEFARALHNLAYVYYRSEDYDKAESLYKRALVIREKTLESEHPDLAASLTGLANVFYVANLYNKANPLYRRALEIKEKAYAADHPEVARAVTLLANSLDESHDHAQAELLYQRALTLAEKSFGLNHPLYARALTNLGIVYKDRGDYAAAERVSQRALEIFEKSYGKDTRDFGPLLMSIGNLYFEQGEYAKAVQFFQRFMALVEKASPDSLDLTIALNNLGNAYVGQGEYAKAEPMFQHALTNREKVYGPENPSVARTLNNLANLYRTQGDYDKAEPLYRRALIIFEKAFGTDSPDLVDPLRGLAILYQAKGDSVQSISYQRRASDIVERNITYNLVAGSERQKLAYLASLSEDADRILSLHVRTAPDNVDARALAVTAVLQRKGRVLDSMKDNIAVLRRRLSADDQALLDRLNETTTQLANLVLNGPQRLSLTEHQKEIRILEEQAEHLEDEISSRSAGFYQNSQAVTLATVQAAVPLPAGLIEFAVYRPFDPKAKDNNQAFGKPRYVAYIVRRQGAAQFKELGEAKPIDEAVNGLRGALRDPQRKDVQQLARAVDEKVMQPVRALLGDATQLLISPDGELNLIPFEALVDEHGRYLIDRYAVTYLTSGRDLLRMQVTRESKDKLLVVANPSFGEPVTEQIAKSIVARKTPTRYIKRRSVTSARSLSEVYFAPLGATAQEARTIRTLFPETNLLTGSQATESALKDMAAPRVLHLATHGFFLQDAGNNAANNAQVAARGTNANARIENPLLRSGLALAGANLRSVGAKDDGILTALEASGLNLWGTKLVVLSACDTGLGEVRNGEGVYGLRRAFVLAGAESLVMSLWPVSDYSTRRLMTSYYKNLKHGMGRGSSLRRVQLDMLKRNRQLHPFYWANFIQSGEWANLDGKR